MKRKETLDAIMETISKYDVVISTTGLISRELYENYDSKQHFYLPGSMGLVSSVGLGIAVNKPKRRIFVIDGDASLLMNLGSMTTIGNVAPSNLVHVVLDNHAYGSCSEEPTVSYSARFPEIAKTVGYNYIYEVDDELKIKEAIKDSRYRIGPILIEVHIELGGRRNLARPLDLENIKRRFKSFLDS